MRLTIVNQFYSPDLSPTAQLATSLAEHRAELGDEVTIVASQSRYVDESAATRSGEEENPRVYRVWTPRLGKRSAIRRCLEYAVFYCLAAWRMMRLPAQDAIISLTTPPYLVWTAVLHKILHPRTRLFLWNMDSYPEVLERVGMIRYGGMLSRFMAGVNRLHFRMVERVICLDATMASQLAARYGRPGCRFPTVTIPNWERASFYANGRPIVPWRGENAAKLTGKFVVLYSGNMGVVHQFDTVLEAADMLRDEPVVFLFNGHGSRRREIEEARRQRGLDQVLIQDYVPQEQLPGLLAAADCALITLRDDMVGVVSPSKLHANLAMGLPILYVGPKGSNVDEAVARFGCGVRVRHGDATGIVQFIHGLSKSSTRRARLRRLARQAFEETYTDRRTLPLFDALLDGPADVLPLGMEEESQMEKAA